MSKGKHRRISAGSSRAAGLCDDRRVRASINRLAILAALPLLGCGAATLTVSHPSLAGRWAMEAEPGVNMEFALDANGEIIAVSLPDEMLGLFASDAESRDCPMTVLAFKSELSIGVEEEIVHLVDCDSRHEWMFVLVTASMDWDPTTGEAIGDLSFRSRFALRGGETLGDATSVWRMRLQGRLSPDGSRIDWSGTSTITVDGVPTSQYGTNDSPAALTWFKVS